MPTEMDERIAEQAKEYGMTYSQYVRQALRENEGTPFECDETVLFADENGEVSENVEGAA